jgi:hypothetical protein
MLFVWLFAIAASWVNACLLQPRGDHARSATDHAAMAATGTAHEVSSGAHSNDPGRVACLDVCDDERSTIPKYATASVADLAAAPMIASALWSLAVAKAAFPRERPLAAAPPPERPVAIRFLRLTI